MSTHNWQIKHRVKNVTKNGRPEEVTFYMLQFNGRTVMETKDELTRKSYEQQAKQWNETNYIPKTNGGECLADHPPEKRSEVLKRMKNSTPGFPDMMIDPVSSANAMRKFKGGSQ